MNDYVRVKPYVAMSDEELIEKSEKLKDLLTPNGNLSDELVELLEVERELTLREER
jgi:preprotein translocase subunit SecA